jgi:hypothetical protein
MRQIPIMNDNEFPTKDEFREYAEKMFPSRVDITWDNVDDWIKYGDTFLKLRPATPEELKQAGYEP